MDNITNQMLRAAFANQQALQESKRRYDEDSHKQLMDVCTKKTRTAFIGALSQFEQFFGFLWGHTKDERSRTPEEKAFYEKWMQARTNILNNGNNQIRAVENEFAQYSITWNRYHTELKPV